MNLDAISLDAVVLLIKIVVIGYIVFRWGGLICMLYFIYYFCTERWTFAALAFLFGAWIEWVKGCVMLFECATGSYNGPWL